jgi:hypothetical protein
MLIGQGNTASLCSDKNKLIEGSSKKVNRTIFKEQKLKYKDFDLV